jgi:hypothetical protein
MDKREGFVPPAIGASSLLVIFAVLCLTVFALLSVSTVQADLRLEDSTAASVLGYYAADCQAEEILSRLRSGSVPDGVTAQDGTYSYTCPISDTQLLSVQVAVAGPDDYTVLRWQMVSSADWQPDDSLPVWNGED